MGKPARAGAKFALVSWELGGGFGVSGPGECDLPREEPMIGWAAIAAILVALLTLAVGEVTTVLANLAELLAVIAVFALVCAAEAWN